MPRPVHGLLGFMLAAGTAPAAELMPRPGGPNAIPSTGPSVHELTPMVVTATGHPEPPSILPVMTSTLDAEDFARTLPRTTPDALRELPSIMLQRTGQAQTSPYLRGFTGFRTVMLVDGIRLNNSTFRDGPNQYWGTIDALALDRLEVIRGPSSVLYGSDSIGGTVNAISRSRQHLGPTSDAEGHGFYRYSTAENSHSSRAEFTGNLGEKIGLAGGLSLKEYGDLRAGEGTGLQSRTGYSEWDGDAKFQYLLSPNTRIVYGHQTVDQDDAWRTHSTRYSKPWEGTVSGTDESRILDQFRNLDYLRLEGSQLDGFIDRFQAGVSYQIQNEDENRLRSDRRREVQGTYVDTLGTSLQVQSPTGIGRWTAGMEFYHDWVDSKYTRYAADGSVQLRRAQGPVGDDSSYDLLGIYLQDHLPLFNERLELIAGGRYNYAAASVGRAVDPGTGAILSFDDSWDTAVGSGRALWHLDDDHRWSIFGGASQGFRAPNLSDLSRFDLADRGEIEVPVFDLKPEEFLALEGGARGVFGRLTAEAAYHHTFIQDMIVRYRNGQIAPTGEAIVMKKNSGEGDIHGFEVTGSYQIYEEWSLWGNYTWMEGTVETPAGPNGPFVVEPVSRLMPSTVNAGLRYERKDRKFWAEFAASIATRQDRLSSLDRRDTQRIPPNGTPGYEVFHLRGGWRPTEKFTLSAALENLTDTKYRIHGSGINEPGLNLVVAADVRF
jgi:hemoglobin/transferrin/lactoferrin receptor protein